MKTIRQTLLLTILTTIAFEIVGCGAADIQSAKLYRQRRDYAAADKMLLRALDEDRTNDEAWYLYTVNLYDLKNYEKVAQIIDTAMLYSATHRAELQQYKRSIWVELYMGGLNTYQANPESKEAQKNAIGYLESARKLAPEQPETYELLGTIYYSGGDTAKGIENYKAEIDQVSAAYDQGIAMGLMLKQSPEAVERAIGGAPAQKREVSIGGNDSALIYIYPSKNAYVYFEKNTKPPFAWQLTGWRVTSSETEGLVPLRVSTQAFEVVANDYYQKGLVAIAHNDKGIATSNFDKAIPLLMTLQQLDPSDEFASTAIPDIYMREEKTEKAKSQYEKILGEHPSKQMYVSYGTLLMKSLDYAGAVGAYEKALALDPGFPSALYDIAAAYKNWAKASQDAKKPEFTQQLEKSTEYFERLRAIDKTDPNVLVQLAENYDVLKKRDKAIALVADMEAIKNTDAANTHDYWEMMARLYARANRSADSEAAYRKADELKQKGK